MYNNYYLIPEELSDTYNEITFESSPYHDTFKVWWNRSVDSIKQDNSATETKRLFNGLADCKRLSDDLRNRVEVKVQNVKQKRETLVNRLTETDSNKELYAELLNIWSDLPVQTNEAIEKSLNLLNEFQPSQPERSFTKAETLYHKIKGIKKVLDQAAILYAKYLGIEKCITFYWEWDQLCYYDEAMSHTPIVSCDEIKNVSIKELIAKGHRPDHGARIRYRYYMEEEEYTMNEAYIKIREDLEQLRPEVTYALPDSVRSFNKTAKNYIKELQDVN
ncbi:hypothetical protein G3570_00730 [Balneolaceae bacterium YR4-1]|uniref:Uncharacterized protein n=1 Tax=Halalkalibaculum roseum TaxID=2709311 RepID=A0A6M1SJE0_9BACT|nr:hypothetical protein [Halalkalibaculum roseum]NGP75139.1 hypothetical protein [Halalkalibaculum roseum]